MLKMKIAHAAAEVDPEIFLVENAEILVNALEQAQTVIVERRRLHFFATQQLAHPLLHLLGGVDGVGESQNLVGLGMTLADQAFNAVGENGSLAGARAGDDQHGATHVFDSLALAIVGSEGSGTGVRLRRRHSGQDNTCV